MRSSGGTPRFLRISVWCATLVAAVAASLVSGTLPAAPASPAPNRTDLTRSYVLPYRIAHAPESAAMGTTVLALLNESRAEAGLRALSAQPTLRRVAGLHGEDMFAYGYLSHQSRDGLLPLARVEAAGLRPWHVGENLAYAQDVREAHRLLMNSPEHRENILSPLYRWIGVAVMDGGPKGVIVVEDFTD